MNHSSTSTPVEQTPTYQHAYWLTTIGYTVVPLHGVAETGRCSCPDPHCPSAGKHPIRRRRRDESPELAIQEVHLAVGRYGWCNLGLVTGKKRGLAPGLVAIDLDVKEGKDGVTAFRQWCFDHVIPEEALHTARARTGSGGMHLLFLHPEGGIKIASRANILVDGGGIDVRGDGGYIAVAPSRHRSGRHYEWIVPPLPENILPLPEVLLDALKGGSRRPDELGRRVQEAHTPDLAELLDLATELERSKKHKTTDVGRDMKRALKGEAIAENGGGHDAFRDVLFFVGQRWPRAEPRETIEHFRESVEARQRLRPDASCGMENLLDSLTSAQAKAIEHEKSWVNLLSYTAKGEIKACEGNVIIVLEHHRDWRDILAHNDRMQQSMLMKQPPIAECAGPFPRPITDADGAQIAKWMTINARLGVSAKQTLACALAVARNTVFDPFRDWLEALPPWDGVPRADSWLVNCAGAADTAYVRAVGRKWLLQAVRRAYEPGAQADYMLILEGAQGLRKSSLLRSLLYDAQYFVEGVPQLGTKDATMALHGAVIVEIAELSAFNKADIESIKAFITTKVDTIRLPYDRAVSYLPRRCIFAGSTNADTYLQDTTGNRRYWPVRVGQCHPEIIAAHREQLWAELVHAHRAGEDPMLDPALAEAVRAEQDARYTSDSWEHAIQDWLAREPAQGGPAPEGFPIHDVFARALGLDDKAKWTSAANKRVANILVASGWTRVQRKTPTSGGRRIWIYVRST